MRYNDYKFTYKGNNNILITINNYIVGKLDLDHNRIYLDKYYIDLYNCKTELIDCIIEKYHDGDIDDFNSQDYDISYTDEYINNNYNKIIIHTLEGDKINIDCDVNIEYCKERFYFRIQDGAFTSYSASDYNLVTDTKNDILHIMLK